MVTRRRFEQTSGPQRLFTSVGNIEVAQQAGDLEDLAHDRGSSNLDAQLLVEVAGSLVGRYEDVQKRRIDEGRLAQVDDDEVVTLDQPEQQVFGLVRGAQVVLAEHLDDDRARVRMENTARRWYVTV